MTIIWSYNQNYVFALELDKYSNETWLYFMNVNSYTLEEVSCRNYKFAELV